jgi:hypothetical protein
MTGHGVGAGADKERFPSTRSLLPLTGHSCEDQGSGRMLAIRIILERVFVRMKLADFLLIPQRRVFSRVADTRAWLDAALGVQH